MGVNRKGVKLAVDCPTDKYYFDRERGNELMEQFVETGVPCNELLSMVNKLYVKLTQHPDYKYYSKEIKDELISQATYEFLKYSHHFKASKARNGSYTFLNWCARNAFNRHLTRHYTHINRTEWLRSDEMVADWYALSNLNAFDMDECAENECLDSQRELVTKSFACKTWTQNIDPRE